jgi:hypothetical protein
VQATFVKITTWHKSAIYYQNLNLFQPEGSFPNTHNDKKRKFTDLQPFDYSDLLTNNIITHLGVYKDYTKKS